MSLSKWVTRRSVGRVQAIEQLLDDLEVQSEMIATDHKYEALASDQALMTRNAIRSQVLEGFGLTEEDLYG